jgi:hypothetical protein
VIIGCQVSVGRYLPLRSIAPFINHQRAIYVEPHAIIYQGMETKFPLLKAGGTRPAYAEVIGRETRYRRIVTPVKINISVITDKSRAALQRHVSKVFSSPLGKGATQLPPDLNLRRAQVFIIFDTQGMIRSAQGARCTISLVASVMPLVNDELVI